MTRAEKVARLLQYSRNQGLAQELAEELEMEMSRTASECRLSAKGKSKEAQKAESNLQYQIAAARKECEAIRKIIDQLPNPTDRELMRRKYVLCQSWSVIADKMHYADARALRRRHNRIVDKMAL